MAPSSSLRNMIFLIAVLYLATIATLHITGSADVIPHPLANKQQQQQQTKIQSPLVINNKLKTTVVDSSPKQQHLAVKVETDIGRHTKSISHDSSMNSVVRSEPLVEHAPLLKSEPIIGTQSPPPLEKEVSLELSSNKKRGKVAYAVTITRDGPYIDGAAVLGQGVKEAHLGLNGHPKSEWDYELVAIVHPDVVKARAPLESLGWKIVEKDLPFKLEEIENQEYAKAVQTNGCCGHLELLKLHAWSLVEYDWVVHLDMDSFVMGAMDELFNTDSGVSIFYTRDYNMSPGRPIDKAPVQGGYICLRPSMQAYDELWAIVKKGDFGKGRGWGGSGIGNFWGGMTIQGLIPYYVVKVAPASYSQEVNRCVYNQMVDAAGDPTSKSRPLATMKVDNCRHTTFEETKNVHFTLCQKPWSCQRGHRQSLCMDYHRAWMRARSNLEKDMGMQPSKACDQGRSGEGAYIPMKL